MVEKDFLRCGFLRRVEFVEVNAEGCYFVEVARNSTSEAMTIPSVAGVEVRLVMVN